MRGWWLGAFLIATGTWPSAARAQQVHLETPQLALAEEHQPGHDDAWLRPGTLAAAASVVPSFFLHGSGAFLVGDRKAARRLAISEGAGLAVLVAAGTLIYITGSSRRLVGSLAPLAIGGFSFFMIGWLADVYAASTGGRPEATAPNFVPRLEGELGYLYVYDPQFRYRSFLVGQADLRAGAFRASPSFATALDDDNQRVALELAFRGWGRSPSRVGTDGSFAELATGLRYHRFGNDGFAVTTPEWHIDGRLDLARVGPSLAGSFVQGQLGAALELYDFDAPGSRISDNAFGLLLARFGFGVYFGDGGRRSGEAQLYYDHRHDDFAAGLGTAGIAAGILGHVGMRGHYYVTRNWGVSGLTELGSAFVAGLSLRYRHTPREQG